jgi:hypothetical protein
MTLAGLNMGIKSTVCTLGIVFVFGTTLPSGRSLAASESAQALGDPVLAAISVAAGMPALESAVVPSGSREIRMRSQQTMVCCEARPVLRLVEGPGEVRGSLWLFRTLVLRPGNPAPRDDERCAPLGNQHTCVRPWNLSSGDWTAVAARLEQLGAWTLSAPCNHSGFSASDSGLLSVQRRIGSSVSTFFCVGPRYEREADGLKANELYEYFLGLSGVIPPEPIRIAK